MKKYISIILVIFILLSSSLALASSTDYDNGYDAGFQDGQANKDEDITVSKAWIDHKATLSESDYESLTDYESGYIEGYAKGLVDKDESNVQVNYASDLGESLGRIYGSRDFQNDDESDWEDALPSDKEIRSMYNLNTQDTEYRDAFIQAFKTSFKDAYVKAYEDALFGPAKITQDQGISDGEEIGKLIGSAFGYKDFYENRDRDYTRDLPTNRVITTEYSLNNDSEEYKDGFLSGFLRLYEESYNTAYREANMNDSIRDEGDALSSGQEIGKLKGEIQANMDYAQRLSNDWKRSIPDDEYIIMEYDLNLQSPNYRDLFISGFYDGYSEGYNAKYKELAQGAGVGKSVSTTIPLAGGSLVSSDNALKINVQQGTYYHPVQMTINTTYDVGNNVSSNLIKASDSYRVSILNTSGNLNNEKPIELSFEYYGDRLKGGIYKLSNGFWTYVTSDVKFEENRIIAEISPSTISATGNVYAVFIDTSAKYFADARGHWAKDEIETYVRRNIIYGYPDGTFKPDRQVTRAEFLWLLSRMNRWNLPYYPVNQKLFTDYTTFGASAEVINYSYAQGYIKGYPDGSFKPNNNISYAEIQTIIRRVTGKNDFKWLDIANKMLHEKKVRSTSFDDFNNKITRAEVVYLLYNLMETMY